MQATFHGLHMLYSFTTMLTIICFTTKQKNVEVLALTCSGIDPAARVGLHSDFAGHAV